METNNQSNNKIPFYICPKCRTHYEPTTEKTHCEKCNDVKLMTCEEYRLYKVSIVKAQKAEKAFREQRELIKQQNTPKCPTCGSTNIVRISTFDRATSILALGIFSGKIGKNYECKNCKARW